MNDKITVPEYDEEDTEGTVIEVPTAAKLLLLRNAGAGKLRVHTDLPLTATEQAKGFPLCPNADDADKGEAYSFTGGEGAQNTLYVTADAVSAVYVMTRS